MRRMDRVDKGLRVTLHDHKIVIGSSTPFYNLDPTLTLTMVIRIRGGNMWEFISGHDLKLEIYDMWFPTLTGIHDMNIMDVATNDWYLQQYNTRVRLESINWCRLYLQAIFISDLLSEDGKIDNTILNGTNWKQHTMPARKIPMGNLERLYGEELHSKAQEV